MSDYDKRVVRVQDLMEALEASATGETLTKLQEVHSLLNDLASDHNISVPTTTRSGGTK